MPMKTYSVTIRETIETTVTVTARNEEEAREKASDYRPLADARPPTVLDSEIYDIEEVAS